MDKAKGWNWEWAVCVLVPLAAVLIACLLLRAHGQHLIYDSYDYYLLGRSINQAGLWRLWDTSLLPAEYSILPSARTYGYPLFVAGCSLMADGTAAGTQYAVYAAQLAVFLAVCRFGAGVLSGFVRLPGFEAALYACTALNPWLLIRTIEGTTDSLSISLVYLALVLLVRAGLGPVGAASVWGAIASVFVAGCAVMVRPANVAVAAVLGLLWLVNPYHPVGRRLAAAPALALAFALPIVPQAMNNHHLCGAYRPLVVYDLTKQVDMLGMRFIKCTTLDRPHELQFLHTNPLLPDGIPPTPEFRKRWPGRYALTCAMHAFSLFDQDNPFTYVRRGRSWYRWPSSVLSFTFLGLCVAGACQAAWLARGGIAGARAGAVWVAGLLVVAAQGVAYLPVVAEARFGASLYLLLSMFLVTAYLGVRELAAARRYAALATAGVALCLFVVACCGVSAWLDHFIWIRTA
jgi:hypothetical protein